MVYHLGSQASGLPNWRTLHRFFASRLAASTNGGTKNAGLTQSTAASCLKSAVLFGGGFHGDFCLGRLSNQKFDGDLN